MPELWPNVSSGRRSAGSPALHSREVVRRTRWPPPHREPQHAWLGILEKRPQETGLTFLWFPCPGTVFSHAGALVSLWRHLLSMCIFAMYVLPVSAVDGRRKGMSEGQCKQRGEQRVFPQPVAQRSHLGDDARALLVLWPFSVRSKSKAPQQSPMHLPETQTLAVVGQTAARQYARVQSQASAGEGFSPAVARDRVGLGGLWEESRTRLWHLPAMWKNTPKRELCDRK